jgi:hypothetical protein
MLGTALCWNGESDWLLHRFDVRLCGDGDGHYHCRVAVKSRVIGHTEQEKLIHGICLVRDYYKTV